MHDFHNRLAVFRRTKMMMIAEFACKKRRTRPTYSGWKDPALLSFPASQNALLVLQRDERARKMSKTLTRLDIGVYPGVT